MRRRRLSARRFALSQLTLLTLALWQGAPVRAQEPGAAAPAPLALKGSTMLQEQVPEDVRKQQPTFVYGDRLSGRPDLETVVEGHAELRHGNMVIRADRLEYYQPDDLAKARGHVRINRSGNVYEGPELNLKVDSFEGFFNEPSYHFIKNDGHGQASRVDFIDEKRAIARNASFTTCRRTPGPDWMPDWILKATSVKFDYEEDVGQADGAVLRFKDVPVLVVPALSFPLSERRKSGFLPPTITVDNLSGLDVVQPYYWDIAPNRDATFYPELMSRRGFNLGAELRYLEQRERGTARFDIMPRDSLRNATRWGLTTTHSGEITSFPAVGTVGLNLKLNRVSDDNYWRDFPRATASLTQRLLANDASLAWVQGDFSAGLRTLKWQTLQDVTTPITPPYDRLPQVTGRYARTNVYGFDMSLDGDYTRFMSDRTLTLQPNANRAVALAQISRPWRAPGWFVVPKMQVHWTDYQFDAPLATGETSVRRAVPTLSLDSGLVFERDAGYFGRSFRQTLEPRAFYVHTPFRNQNFLPNYDSGINDFNFVSVYSENPFGGNDRIADTNLLTLGVTSRLLDPTTGAEAVRLSVAQRLRFKDQNITLPGGAPVTDRISDLLMGATINWTPQWMLDSIVQFNPKTERSVRSTIGARYSPSNYRVVSAAYRLQRGTSEQLDIGWQWPINDLWGDNGADQGPGRGLGEGRWYSVGRMNYSMVDRKLVDSIFGFEYDAGCWLGRVVLERLQRSGASANQRILFQLEFVGFSRLGSNPLQTLKQNIPRYQYLREQTTTPSRFTNYE